MITYQPSRHFIQGLKQLDNYFRIKWNEVDEQIEIWSVLPNKRPVMEHKYCRNNKARDPKKPLYNWDMEWIVLQQLRHARRWQFLSVADFQNEMLENRERTKAQGEAEADSRFDEFLSDPYWHKKRLQERDNKDLGRCTTQWAGSQTNPGGQKNDENMEPQRI